jgi:FkbM family methyltransferase
MHSEVNGARANPLLRKLAYAARSFLGTHGVAAQISVLRQRVEDLAASAASEAEQAPAQDPVGELEIYRGYTESDVDLMRKYQLVGAKPQKGFVTDFLGGRTSVAYMHAIGGLDGAVNGLPVPANWHAEAAEWAGILKPVEHAGETLAVMELGAGWGPAVIACGLAGRRRGIKDIRLCAVEGDPTHYEYLVEHFRNNGFDPAQHDLLEAAVGVEDGEARWPKVVDPAGDWGSRPMLSSEEGQTDHVGRTFDAWLDIKVVSFKSLLLKQPVWDLVHIDVQGHEMELCIAEADLFDTRVRWLNVGTHNYKLHGDLMDMMFQKGWILENEKPPRIKWSHGAPSLINMTTHDGIQVWRNPALTS